MAEQPAVRQCAVQVSATECLLLRLPAATLAAAAVTAAEWAATGAVRSGHICSWRHTPSAFALQRVRASATAASTAVGPTCLRCTSAPSAARVCGATLMWGISGKLKKKYGVEGDVREVLYEVRRQLAAPLLTPWTEQWRGMWGRCCTRRACGLRVPCIQAIERAVGG